MSELPGPYCEPLLTPAAICAMDAASESLDDQSKLKVTSKSMASVDSYLLDEQNSYGECSVLDLMSVSGDFSLETISSTQNCVSQLRDENLSQPSPETQPTRSASGKSTSSSCIDAHNPSTILSESIIDADPKEELAETDNKSCTNDVDLLASRLKAETLISGNIGAFHEYIRPNAETSFIFSFTPMSGDQNHATLSSKKPLVGFLEKTQIEKSPLPPSQISIRLRKKRGIETKSLTLGDTSSQDQSDLDTGKQHAMRKKSATEPAPLADTDSNPDVKMTADRRRFDFLVSRLQQKLSERSQGSCGGSIKHRSSSEVSRRSSRSDSIRFKDGISPTNMPLSSADIVNLDSTAIPSNDERTHNGIHAPGDSQFEAQANTQQWLGPEFNPLPPQQLTMPASQPTNYLPPPLLFPLLPQMPQLSPMWNAHTPLALGYPGYTPLALPANQPRMIPWPSTPEFPPYSPLSFDAHRYTYQPYSFMQLPPLPHGGTFFPASGGNLPPRPPQSSPIARGKAPFVPFNASVQQQIEENIEFLKATVPSFALGSRQRQKQRWLRQKTGSDEKGKQNKWNGQPTGQRREKWKDAQAHQPRVYHQPQHQYPAQVPSMPNMPMYGLKLFPYPGLV